jgi:hypothetical protein
MTPRRDQPGRLRIPNPELVAELSLLLDLPKGKILEVIGIMKKVMTEAFSRGEKINIPGLGTFVRDHGIVRPIYKHRGLHENRFPLFKPILTRRKPE